MGMQFFDVAVYAVGAGGICLAVFRGLQGDDFGAIWSFPDAPQSSATEVVFGAIVGAIAGGVGIAFRRCLWANIFCIDVFVIPACSISNNIDRVCRTRMYVSGNAGYRYLSCRGPRLWAAIMMLLSFSAPLNSFFDQPGLCSLAVALQTSVTERPTLHSFTVVDGEGRRTS